jgi:hypothetical protein
MTTKTNTTNSERKSNCRSLRDDSLKGKATAKAAAKAATAKAAAAKAIARVRRLSFALGGGGEEACEG